MVGAKNIHDVSATTPVQKRASVAALTKYYRTCCPRRHTDRQYYLGSCSKRHSRLRGHLARSSKYGVSSSQDSPESTEQQGVERKHFLQALSGKVILIIPHPVLSHVYIGHALPKCITCNADSLLAPFLSLRLPGRASASKSRTLPEPGPGQVGAHILWIKALCDCSCRQLLYSVILASSAAICV